MEKLFIKNFGPIKDGLGEGQYIDVLPLTVFCGNQATGKSTIAKLYSSFLWLEKAFVKGDLNIKSFSTDDFFSISNNQRIRHYFRSNTYLEYKGEACDFTYKDGKFSAILKNAENSSYERPKIMYVPSERNLLTALEDAERINGLPAMLSVFLDEYNRAKKKMNGDIYSLPVSGVNIKYDKDSLQTIVLTDTGAINISEASSGIQSVAPLSLVTRYISDDMALNTAQKVQRLSSVEREAIAEDIRKKYSHSPSEALSLNNALNIYFNAGITKDGNERIEALLGHYFNTRFINIVEEPEQNLYPQSQSLVLYELVGCLNRNEKNKLILTTHSPYILSYLILLAKAFELKTMGIETEKLTEFVPEEAFLSGDRIAIYETSQDGTIRRLESQYGLPSDDNELNLAMTQTNDIFSDFLDLEASLAKS